MWIIISQIICLAATIGLLAIAYDLDRETPAFVRITVVGMCVAFFGVFIATRNNPALYEHAASIAFTGMGALVVFGCVYLVVTKQIHVMVIRVAGGALAVSMLLWTVGSCSDTKRQKIQIDEANKPAVTAPPITEEEQRNRDIINRSKNRKF